MIANVSAHRRANAFAQALEERIPGGRTAEPPGASAEGAEQVPGRQSGPGSGQTGLLALVDGLHELPAPQLDPEVKTVQRAQLVAAMEAMFAEGTAGEGPGLPGQRSGKGAHRASPLRNFRQRSRWSQGLAAGGLTVGVAAGAFSGVAAASSDALPGDSLYGLKRGMEDLKLGMAEGNTDRGEIYLNQASTRMHEARRLMERGRTGSLDHEQLAEVRRVLSGMSHDASEGHRLLHEAYERDGSLGPIQVLDAFSKSHRGGWRALRDRLPVQLTDVGDDVSSVFDAIDDEVGPLKSLLPAPPGGEQGPGRSSTSDRPGGDSGRTSLQPAPSSADTSEERDGRRSKPRPSASTQDAGGLIGGAGDLLNPPTGGTSAPSDKDNNVPEPQVTLPPLLPGLLPGLGIDGENTQ